MMSHAKCEISVAARVLLGYITFRTRNGYPFFENNSTIAQNLALTEGTTKELINQLVRKGYLEKSKDERNRRQLKLTGLKFPQVYINFQEAFSQNDEIQKIEQELKVSQLAVDTWRERHRIAQVRIMELEQQVAELQGKLNASQGTHTPQNDNAITIKEEDSNNNKSIVNVESMDNVAPTDNPKEMYAKASVKCTDNSESVVRTDNISVGDIPNGNAYQSVADNNGYGSVDARTLVAQIMDKYNLQKATDTAHFAIK